MAPRKGSALPIIGALLAMSAGQVPDEVAAEQAPEPTKRKGNRKAQAMILGDVARGVRFRRAGGESVLDERTPDWMKKEYYSGSKAHSKPPFKRTQENARRVRQRGYS